MLKFLRNEQTEPAERHSAIGLQRAKDRTLDGTAQAGGTYGFGTVFALARPGK